MRHDSLLTAVRWSHHVLAPRLLDGDVVVDMTAGNGHDTLFLAQHVLPRGRVFAFDVQAGAVEATRLRISESEGVTLIHAGHEDFASHLPVEQKEKVRAFMFNLGFLPGGDKALITRTETTLRALREACEWLADDGIITVVAYPGHEAGRTEADAVVQWMSALPSDKFETQRIGFLNFRATTPFLMVLRKRTP